MKSIVIELNTHEIPREKILIPYAASMYTFVESRYLSKANKTSAENRGINIMSAIISFSALLIGSLRKPLPLKIIKKFTTTSTAKEIHNGIARYHLSNNFLASNKKSTEPKKDTMLNNSIKSEEGRST